MKQFQHIKRWTFPKNYFGARWDGFFVFLSQHRDSDCLERANFDAGLAAVREVASKDSIPGDQDEGATVQRVRENNWAVGWVEWVAIHESDLPALEAAEAILARLGNYPVADEDLFSQYETEEAGQVWANCYNPAERIKYIRENKSQFDFRSFSDLMQCVRGKYFAGYASELIN